MIKPGAVIFANDVEKVATFYAAILPMTIHDRDDGTVRLEDAATQLVVHSLPGTVVAAHPVPVPPPKRWDSHVKLVFSVDSIARARAAAPDLGGMVEPVAAEFVWKGFRACDGHDPEGNVVQFRELA